MLRRLSTLVVVAMACLGQAQYTQTNLVSDGAVSAAFTDPNLVNPWGLAASPTGEIWISDNGTGLSTLYNADGSAQSLVVTTQDDPDGIVFYGGSGFLLGNGKASRFIFASEGGIIDGWNGAAGSTAQVLFDESSSGASFKGLGVIGDNIYASNFQTGEIEMFNDVLGFQGAFTDSSLTPLGYAPFGIQAVGNDLFVTYALVGADGDDVAGPGNGYLDEFDASGNLIRRVYSNGVLNSPWGMALAPSDFGAFSNDLLVSNFGDGTINAFDVNTGDYLGTIGSDGKPLVVDGIWGLAFGNGGQSGPKDTLYFTAGLNHEADGLYGSIHTAPGPEAAIPMIVGVVSALRRRRR